ncbi:MAG: ATP-dependent endonuclease [Actinomycetota bacterium]|nr:ATP-dependent endonuclease [Actinomycetota bacterium]
MEPGVVLVEGESDRRAVEALGPRVGLDPTTYRVVAMGGVTNIARHLRELLTGRDDALVPLVAGLADAGEEHVVARALATVGFGRDLDRWDLEGLGFFSCVDDLEDELIRAVGAPGVLEVIERERDLGPFHTLQTQPAHRDRTPEQQLHRFLGSGAGRKIRYAPLLVKALPADSVPAPLRGLVEHVGHWAAG